METLVAIETFLEPIPGDEPAGSKELFYALKTQLDEDRKEIDPELFAKNDPMRPVDAKAANWERIVETCTDALQNKLKHLQLASRLTEAWTKLHGTAGLYTGLKLLDGMVEQCWDRMHPASPEMDEDADLDDRCGPFDWISEDTGGARFPPTVRTIPLVKLDGKGFGLIDWKLVQGGRGVGKETLDRAVSSSSRAECKETLDQFTQTLEAFTQLSNRLGEVMGSSGPGLSDLRAAIGEVYGMSQEILKQKGPAEEEASDSDETNGTVDPETTSTPSSGNDSRANAERTIATRADVYRKLGDAATLLEKLEPHSPIPYLIRRAIDLGAMPFPQLMKALIRNDSVLTEMNREFGIDPASQ